MRRTLPRLDSLGLGSYDSYSVVATATDYLPEAIGAYLRLPRDWADSRPVEKGKTPLLLLVDQLDLLGATMEKIYDAANSTDAAALITHGRFLQERFGHPTAAVDLTMPPPTDQRPRNSFEPQIAQRSSRMIRWRIASSFIVKCGRPDLSRVTITGIGKPRGSRGRCFILSGSGKAFCCFMDQGLTR